MKKNAYTKYFVVIIVICFTLLMIPGIGKILKNSADDKFEHSDKILYYQYYNIKLETDYAISKLEAIKTNGTVSVGEFGKVFDEISWRYNSETCVLMQAYIIDVGRYKDLYPAILDDFMFGIGQRRNDFNNMNYDEVEKYYKSLFKIFKAWSDAGWPSPSEYTDYNISEDPADLKGKVKSICDLVDAEMKTLGLK